MSILPSRNLRRRPDSSHVAQKHHDQVEFPDPPPEMPVSEARRQMDERWAAQTGPASDCPDLAGEAPTLESINVDPALRRLDSVVLTGRFLGDPFVGRFVPSAEYEAIPEGERPAAMRVQDADWLVCFEPTEEARERRRLEREARDKSEAEARAAKEAEEHARATAQPDRARVRELLGPTLRSAIDRFEDSSRLLGPFLEFDRAPTRVEYLSRGRAYHEAGADLRDTEVCLAQRLLAFINPDPDDLYRVSRYRPYGVVRDGILYAVTYDPTTEMEEPSEPFSEPIIVARIEMDRVLDLDAIDGPVAATPAPPEPGPEPAEDDGLTSAQRMALPTIFRAAERWDDARIAVANRGRTAKAEEAATQEARHASVAMAERDARQLEAVLAERIQEFHGDDPSIPGRMEAEYDALDRLEPCGVWVGDTLYLVTHDSTEALNDDEPDRRKVIIVARVHADRVIDLGEPTGTL